MTCVSTGPIFFRDDRPFMQFMTSFSESTRLPMLHFVVSIILLCMVQLVFHIFITTRGEMKKLNTRRQLQFLLVSATFTCLVDFVRYFGELVSEYTCSGKYSFTYAILNMLEPFAWALPHQATIWTLIYITVFRVNIVIERRFGSRYVLSRKLTLTVCLVCASPVVISEFIRTMELHLKEVVDPDEQLRGCNAKLYELENRKFECKFEQVRSLLGVVMAEVIPCSILLISTIFLISELNGNHLISSLETQKRTFSGNRTLVIFLIFFLSTEIPLMFIFGVGIISEADFYALDEKMYIFEDCFIYLCMSFGYLQYCVMSSYYRDAVCSLVGRSKARNSVGTTRRIMSECNQTPPAILT